MAFIPLSPLTQPAPELFTTRRSVCCTAKGAPSGNRIQSRRAFLTSTAAFTAYTLHTKQVNAESTVSIEDLVVGEGKGFSSGEQIKMHYTLTTGGFQSDGGKVIDSSRTRGKPFSYTYDSGMVIKGWDIGVTGMKVGGRRRLIIPAELGYGARGVGKIIPPNTSLYFDIELLGVGFK